MFLKFRAGNHVSFLFFAGGIELVDQDIRAPPVEEISLEMVKSYEYPRLKFSIL